MSKPAQLVIKFSSAALRDEFRGWLSDGGGEYGFMGALEIRGEPPVDIDYDGNTVTVRSRDAARGGRE